MPKNVSDPREEKFEVVTRGPFKLKDTMDRRQLLFDFQKVFEFIPEKIVIEKVPGEHNAFFVHAIKPNKGPKIILPYGKN